MTGHSGGLMRTSRKTHEKVSPRGTGTSGKISQRENKIKVFLKVAT
jgi:hypothetical protein